MKNTPVEMENVTENNPSVVELLVIMSPASPLALVTKFRSVGAEQPMVRGSEQTFVCQLALFFNAAC